MFTDIRHWAEALLDRAEERGLRSEYCTTAHVGVRLPRGCSYVNATDPSAWRVRTSPDGPLRRDFSARSGGDAL